MLDLLHLRGCTVEITLVNDRFMKEINARTRNVRRTTDVLSFPQITVTPRQTGQRRIFSHQHLGDILISLDQAARQAKLQDLTLTKEVAFLIVHSLLHLIGYDHDTPRARARMQSCESKLWRKLQENKINSKF